MKSLLLTLSLTLSSLSFAGTAMNYEGSCKGALKDGTPVSFTHYSNFNGCRKVSTAAVSFSSGLSGLYTGSRYFKNDQDIYSFTTNKKEQVRLSFANSTDVVGGTLTYVDEENGGKKASVPVQCEIRIYSYADC